MIKKKFKSINIGLKINIGSILKFKLAQSIRIHYKLFTSISNDLYMIKDRQQIEFFSILLYWSRFFFFYNPIKFDPYSILTKSHQPLKMMHEIHHGIPHPPRSHSPHITF